MEEMEGKGGRTIIYGVGKADCSMCSIKNETSQSQEPLMGQARCWLNTSPWVKQLSLVSESSFHVEVG